MGPGSQRVNCRSSALLGSALLYVVALLTPALHVDSTVVLGGTLLTQGWRALSDGYIEWLANPLLLFSWLAVVRRRPYAAFVLALVASGLMLLFLARGPLQSAAHPGTHAVHYALGFWLWLASALCALCGAGCSLPRAGKAQILGSD